MGPAAAAAYVALLAAEEPGRPPGPAGEPAALPLSARERELVALVARGHTNAQIAEQLFISVRTVSSHLDRIRDKTGCRRRRPDPARPAGRPGLAAIPHRSPARARWLLRGARCACRRGRSGLRPVRGSCRGCG